VKSSLLYGEDLGGGGGKIEERKTRNEENYISLHRAFSNRFRCPPQEKRVWRMRRKEGWAQLRATSQLIIGARKKKNPRDLLFTSGLYSQGGEGGRGGR